jgi:benzoyl-CoA reductase/2-hydroxyglutaryl-CoA dehydratase subunit BcrC/BadD/HgdB
MSPLERFRVVAKTPIGRWHQQFPDRRPLGIYNAYVPVEMFRAAGLVPVYLFHRPEDRGYARTHLPAFACWPARSLVDQALDGELDGLVGLALGQTCDAVQALTDVWRRAMPTLPLYHVGVPSSLAGPAVRDYFLQELTRLRQRLGNPSDDALRRAIALTNRTRELVLSLYDRAADLAPVDIYAALRAGLIMPAAEYNALLAELLEELPARERAGPRLILVGPHLADPMLYEVVQEAGGVVVDDLLDVGHRYYAGRVGEEGDPLTALVDHYLALLPTPTKHHPDRQRGEYLVEQVAHRQAYGVIFARQIFCDPHGFDTVPLRAALDRAGVPHLLVELEQTPQAGQVRTRVEAFLEMMGA